MKIEQYACLLRDEWSQNVLEQFSDAKDDDPAIERPSMVSRSSDQFYRTLFHTFGILFQLINLSIFSDNAALVAKKILQKDSDLPRDFNPYTPLDPAPGPFQRRLNTISDDLMEMIVVRLCDNFTTYTSDIIRECLHSKPEALRSKESITLEMALSFGTIDELQEFVVDRKVNELAYLGFSKLSDWIADKLGASDLSNAPSYQAISTLLEIRNCVVHNRGRASRKYMQSPLAPKDVSVGSKLKISVDDVYIAARATCEITDLLDGELTRKFPVPRETFL